MRVLPSGDESGTASEDRRFRPDVAGLRAVAVLLVVLFHAGVSTIGGGYIGVDVFFVISGFVITGVLLRERVSSGSTSILGFYGRRCRRIIPAATVVIIATVAASYIFLGSLAGHRSAVDGRWAAVFLANFHFAAEGTNYLAAQAPPSPLQQFWSLAVEEQFYLVYPTLFLFVASARFAFSFRARLAIGLSIVIVGSFALSVVQTSSNPTVAYFSPFTRAWELALGALVSVGTSWLLKVPARLAAVATWLGLGAVVVAGFAFSAQTPYPGSLVAIPVVGTALIIAGGTAAPRFGAEALLGLGPFQTLGKLSYSLYLWHWPTLIIAAEYFGKTTLPVSQDLALLAVALLASVVSYNLVENPIRHARFAMASKWASVALGVTLIAITVIVVTLPTVGAAGSGGASPGERNAPESDAAVQAAVTAATQIQRVPADLTPSLEGAASDWGGPPGLCSPATLQVRIPQCLFGDPNGSHTMVLYGDSHALMWFQAMNDIAIRARWRLFIVAKGYCKVDDLPVGNRADYFGFCGTWQQFAVNRIKTIHPDLLIMTQSSWCCTSQPQANGASVTPAQWQQGLMKRLKQLATPRTALVVLGDIPRNAQSPPDCLARHSDDVQACSGVGAPFPSQNAERVAVERYGGRYIDVTPWFCTARCSPIIGRYEVYLDRLHITATYAHALEQVLAEKLMLTGVG
jgi:peptidoglycan/LPS O-acetylase OafA/YrhL